ncbi:HlyD family secretion protein [Alicyclobacillus sp. SO9]|uniref:HlyD family secretion protein n=1 Tax=Alicyclobacillus sp. SO9 TaxID=2665646 RepID=UPI0018E8B036|nr:efflux RND transporter periplasmic adaptor subunit [Alicyclobacillus sp. SO9]QQE77142.1 HlyD family secretion protein [Alicyclobacillus sp. SO9]
MSTRRIFLLNILIFIVVIVGGFIAYYFYNQSTLYLKTDNAKIAGQEIPIASPVAGQLTQWNGTVGTTFDSGKAVGTVKLANGKTATIPMPDKGTVVRNSAVTKEYVAPGSPLAYAYNLKDLWVTANIKETNISDVKVGQNVDVYVSAFPGVNIKGTIAQIGLATKSTFSLLPSSNDNANFTKVTQVIPVKITLQGYQGIGLTPGMSATVRIHKNS